MQPEQATFPIMLPRPGFPLPTVATPSDQVFESEKQHPALTASSSHSHLSQAQNPIQFIYLLNIKMSHMKIANHQLAFSYKT